MEDSVALVKSFEQIGFEDLIPGMYASLPYKPEDEAEDKKEENKFSCCQVCKDQYEEDNERDLWTPSIKLEVQFICIACQLEKWSKLKKLIKDATVKLGFDIVNDETKTIVEDPLVFKIDPFESEKALESNQKRCTCHEGNASHGKQSNKN